jgi:hypothetical protein
MDVMVSTLYLDFNDVETPIKRQYDASNYVYINKDLSTYHDINLAKSEYVLYDNLFWSDTVSSIGEFYQVDYSTHHVSERESVNDYLVYLDIQMSNKIYQYERRIYSFYTLASNIGGFFEIVHITCKIIVGYFSFKIYSHTLLNTQKSKLAQRIMCEEKKPLEDVLKYDNSKRLNLHPPASNDSDHEEEKSNKISDKIHKKTVELPKVFPSKDTPRPTLTATQEYEIYPKEILNLKKVAPIASHNYSIKILLLDIFRVVKYNSICTL